MYPNQIKIGSQDWYKALPENYKTLYTRICFDDKSEGRHGRTGIWQTYRIRYYEIDFGFKIDIQDFVNHINKFEQRMFPLDKHQYWLADIFIANFGTEFHPDKKSYLRAIQRLLREGLTPEIMNAVGICVPYDWDIWEYCENIDYLGKLSQRKKLLKELGFDVQKDWNLEKCEQVLATLKQLNTIIKRLSNP